MFEKSGLPGLNVNHGLLTFENINEIQPLINWFIEQETNMSSRDSAFEEIGIPISKLDSFFRYTDHPVCKKFENTLGYTSLRSIEEYELFDRLDASDTISSIIINPQYKTIQNEYGAFKVGERILKVFPSGMTVVISNSDYTLYNAIKDLPEESINDTFNLRKIGAIDSVGNGFYTKVISPFGFITHSKKELRFKSTINPDSSVSYTNVSFIEYEDGTRPSFTYTYPDLSTTTGTHPTKSVSTTDSIKVTYGNITNGWEDAWIYPRHCAVNIHMWWLTDGRFYFRLNDYYHSPLVYPSYLEGQYEWNFGDGSPIVVNSEATHTYLTSGEFTVTVDFVTYKWGYRHIWCTSSKPVKISCTPKVGNTSDENIFPPIHGNVYRLDVAIWVGDSPGTQGDIGARTKFLRRRTNGSGFYSHRADKITVAIEGLYHIRPIPFLCLSVYTPPNLGEFENNSGNVQINITELPNPAISPLDLFSQHSFTHFGETHFYPKDNNKLILP